MPDSDAPRFVGVAHAAGNDRFLLRRAVEAGVDFVEADVWPRGDRIVAHHERRAGSLPLLWDKWFLKLDFRPVCLEEIAEAAAGRVRVYVDVKSGSPGFMRRVLDALRHGGALDGAALSGHHWRDLVEARRATGVPVFPSIPDGPALDRFWAFHERESGHIDGVAIRHWLLTVDVAAALRQRGLLILPWTVDSHRRAHELMDLGVDGVISNHVWLLHEMAARAALSHPPSE